MNKDEIVQWYGENYNGMVGFLRNKKKGGDGRQLSEEDAEDILGNTFVYYLGDPDKFESKWVWHKLVQMRKDFYEKADNRTRLELEYRQMVLEVDDEYQIYTEEEEEVLRQELEGLEVRKQRTIMEYMRGDKLDVTKRSVVNRFKKILKEKYRDSVDDGYRE